MRASSLSKLLVVCAIPAFGAVVTPPEFEQYSAFKDIRWLPKRIAAVRGDTILVSFLARGKGRATMSLFCYGAKDEWCGGSGNKAMFLSDEWRRFDHKFIVGDNKLPTAKVAISFGIPKGDDPDFAVKDFSYEFVPTHNYGRKGSPVEGSYALVRDAAGKVKPLSFAFEAPETFDPIKQGWPLAFSDEYDGNIIDTNKWTHYPPSYKVVPNPNLRLDGQGHLEVLCQTNAHGKLVSAGMWSRKDFLWGYYEARVKYTHQPGWWAAFWMYATNDTNPLLDGYEIDIFEDNYMRSKTTEGEWGRCFSTTVHSIAGGVMKSWDYTGAYEGSSDDWHTIGCLRTPFGIAVYSDGKLVKAQAVHSPHPAIIFDPFNHAAATTPLHLIVSGQCEPNATGAKGVFPEKYLVDYVRAYEMPADPDAPTVRWSSKKDRDRAFLREGETLDFGLETSGGKMRGAYLFDNGNLIDWCEKPPYRFRVPFTEERYGRTPYLEPARTGVKTKLLNGFSHVFTAAVQDEKGRVAWTRPLIRVPDPSKPNAAPFVSETATAVPGTFKVPPFPQVGNKTTHVRLSVSKSGRYKLSFTYGTETLVRNALLAAVDGRWTGAVRLPSPGEGFRPRVPASLTLDLPSGEHVLTLFVIGHIDFSAFEIIEEK